MTAAEVSFLGGTNPLKIKDTISVPPSVCPIVNTQSSDTLIAEGGSLSLFVQTSEEVNYRWQVNKGSGWEYITDTNVTELASDTLRITGLTSAMDQYLFRCKVSNDCSVFSDDIKLTISPITNVLLDEKLKASVYPNPSNGNFFLKMADIAGSVDLSLLTPLGQPLFVQSYDKIPRLVPINVDGISGVYFLKIRTSSGVETQRIVISRD